MNKILKEIAEKLEHGNDECGMCHDSFPTVQLRAVLYQNTIRLACPGCVAKIPNAFRSSMSVGEIQAWKHGRAADIALVGQGEKA